MGICKRLYGEAMTKHKFYYGEETYTICVTTDDWWLEDGPADMSNLMMKCGEEFALDHGMKRVL